MATPTTKDTPVRRGPLRSVKIWFYTLFVLAIPVLAFALYVYLRLHWSYSDGDRSGILQKVSHKGWLCKTYEGELSMSYLPGAAPQIWSFSVRDEDVARQINAALGRKVVLHYQEHPNVPTNCFGETDYFVDAVRLAE